MGSTIHRVNPPAHRIWGRSQPSLLRHYSDGRIVDMTSEMTVVNAHKRHPHLGPALLALLETAPEYDPPTVDITDPQAYIMLQDSFAAAGYQMHVIGEFIIIQPISRVVVEISGGAAQEIYSPFGTDVTVVDYDNIEAGDNHPFGDDTKMTEYLNQYNLLSGWDRASR